MSKKISLICLALIVGFILLSPRLTMAQSLSSLQSRIFRLESANAQMRSRFSRLEGEISRLGGRVPSPAQRENIPAPVVPQRANQQVSSSDPMFQRLATLVIELKERINALEEQVAELKKQ
ncbi:MAG: hypothetical protein F6K31_40540 [Symploca sp. SIO2G7]|nr:hypothetical protein [Symploca sp. SIO2G7]